MQIVAEVAEKYAEAHTSFLDDLRHQVEQETLEKHTHAHMISGHVQGVFLEMVSTMLHPKHILEIGTFTGFSALCLAKGLAIGGTLDTIELREEDAKISQAYFNKSPEGKSITLHAGEAHSIIPTLTKIWDLVFIDADKAGYIDYYELTLPMLRPGGFLLADNVLFHGQVLDENISGKNAVAIDAFNKHVLADERVDQVILTIRDGLMLIRKKTK